jgi:hypothetical protein
MKWTTAAAVLLVLVAPVPAIAGAIAYGLTLLHIVPWALRQS